MSVISQNMATMGIWSLKGTNMEVKLVDLLHKGSNLTHITAVKEELPRLKTKLAYFGRGLDSAE